MSYFVKQSSATRPLLFLLIQSSDHISPATGLTPTVTISKSGGSFASPSGTVTEIANGWYQVAANATDSNTLGPLILHATASGADPTDMLFRVVAFDPDSATNLGLTNVDATISSRAASGAQMDLVNAPNATAVAAIQSGLATSSAQSAVKAKTDLIATNSADSPNAITAQTTVSTNLNATVSSRSTYAGGAVASVTAPVSLPALAGMTADKAIRVLVALLGGKTTVGSSTVTFLDTDGATSVLTITYGSTPGSRTAVTIN